MPLSSPRADATVIVYFAHTLLPQLLPQSFVYFELFLSMIKWQNEH